MAGVKSCERFNIAALTYALTGPAHFKGRLSIKKLGSLLTDFVASEEGLRDEELSSSSGYV